MTEKKIPISSEDDAEGEAGAPEGEASEGSNGNESVADDADILESLSVGEEAAELRSEDRDADFSLFGKKNEEAEKEIAQLKAENTELKEKYLRALAESENIKKRAVKERSELLKYQGERVFVDLLAVADNFDRAIEATEQYTLSEDGKQLKEGVELIHGLFFKVLEKWEVKGESSVGETFDPQKQEAISQIPSPDHQAGTVMNELERAFYYKDKLIRPGKVVVASEPVAEQGEAEGESEE